MLSPSGPTAWGGGLRGASRLRARLRKRWARTIIRPCRTGRPTAIRLSGRCSRVSPKTSPIARPSSTRTARCGTTFRELNDEARLVARGLMAEGVARGERVAVWATNVPEWIVLQFALAKIGAVLVTANTSLRAHEIDTSCARARRRR